LEIGAKTMVVVETMMKEPLVIHHQIKMVPSDQGIQSLLQTPIIVLGEITKPPIMDPATIQLAINVVMSAAVTGTEVTTLIQDLLGIVLREVMIL